MVEATAYRLTIGNRSLAVYWQDATGRWRVGQYEVDGEHASLELEEVYPVTLLTYPEKGVAMAAADAVLAEEGNLSHATHRLFVSQPALTKQTKQLEGQLGVWLCALPGPGEPAHRGDVHPAPLRGLSVSHPLAGVTASPSRTCGMSPSSSPRRNRLVAWLVARRRSTGWGAPDLRPASTGAVEETGTRAYSVLQ